MVYQLQRAKHEHASPARKGGPLEAPPERKALFISLQNRVHNRPLKEYGIEEMSEKNVAHT